MYITRASKSTPDARVFVPARARPVGEGGKGRGRGGEGKWQESERTVTFRFKKRLDCLSVSLDEAP